MYKGKEKPPRVYVALHMNINTATHVQVHKQVFFNEFNSKNDSPLAGWCLNGERGIMRR